MTPRSIFRKTRTDLPFENDQSTRLLPFIIAVMVLLAVLALAAALVVEDAVRAWDNGLSGRLTIQVPADIAQDDAPLDRLLDALVATPGVLSARSLTAAATGELLEPWLGEAAFSADLPLPRIIDVQLDADGTLDTTLLSARLANIAPGIAIDDHRVWLAGLIDLARSLEIAAAAIVAVIAAGAVITVIFATRSGLAVHYRIIELLHLMGARDAYVAKQFQFHAMRLGLRGSLLGSIAAAIILFGIAYVSRGIDAAFLPAFSLSPLQLISLVLVPVASVLIAMATAHHTVMRALAQML